MNTDYLQKYYHYERNHWWFQVRERIIVQQLNVSLPTGKGLKILNAGCATGRSSQMLQQYGEVTSVEKDHDTCMFVRDVLGLPVLECDLEALPFEDEYFDVVCIFDVIEHVDQQEHAISELSRVCKPGGVIYCSVPAYNFLWSRHDEVNQHMRRYTRRGIKLVLEKGFAVEYSTYFNIILFFPILVKRKILQRVQKSKEEVSDFESNKTLNGRFFSFFFKRFFSIELLLLRFFKLPFGVSVLLRGRKKKSFSQDDKHL